MFAIMTACRFLREIWIVTASTSCKKVILQDFHDKSESMVTIREPQHTVEAEVGQAMALYDARESIFSGGSLDTSSKTLIVVSDTEEQVTEKAGILVGFGIKGDEEVAEIIIKDDEEETTFRTTMKSNELPKEYKLEIKGDVITAVYIINQDEDDQMSETNYSEDLLDDDILGD